MKVSLVSSLSNSSIKNRSLANSSESAKEKSNLSAIAAAADGRLLSEKSECDQYFSPKYQNTAITDYILSVRPNLKSKSAEIRQFEEALRKTEQHQEVYSLVQSYLHLPRIAKEIDQSDQEWIREEVKQHATFRSIQALSQEIQATAKELKPA